MTIRHYACKTCGSVVMIEADGEAVIDNSEAHTEWHRKQDALFKALSDAVAELGGTLARLTGTEA